MAKKKAKRYTDAKKAEILNFIESKGRGGQAAALKKFKVSAATINSWRKKSGRKVESKSKNLGTSSKLKVVQELIRIRAEIDAAETKLVTLQKQHKRLRSKV